MKLTTKGRNAVTAMLDLCLYAKNAPVSLAAINQRQGVSVHYLEQIFLKLKKINLVRSVRGPGGGYMLGRDPEKISIAEVINSVDDIQVTQCGGQGNCHDGKMCIGHDLWENLSQVLSHHLSNISLAAAARDCPHERCGNADLKHYLPVMSKINNKNSNNKILGDKS